MNNELHESGKLSNSSVTVEVFIPETQYGYNINFESAEVARKTLKSLEKRQLLLRNGAVVNIEEDVNYEVKPATLN